MKRFLLSFLTLGLLAGVLSAGEMDVRTRVALALQQAKNKSPCGCTSCTCAAGECGDLFCPANARTTTRSNYPTAPGALEWQLYLLQYQKAVKAGKPLLIWVGETCPACESNWSEWVHARLSDYNGETGPEVIVAKPDGLGGMSILSRLDGIPSHNAIAALLESRPQATQAGAVAMPVLRPMPMMMPMMGGCGPMGCGPMMGGFGGGMMMGGGGGCGGGG